MEVTEDFQVFKSKFSFLLDVHDPKKIRFSEPVMRHVYHKNKRSQNEAVK